MSEKPKRKCSVCEKPGHWRKDRSYLKSSPKPYSPCKEGALEVGGSTPSFLTSLFEDIRTRELKLKHGEGRRVTIYIGSKYALLVLLCIHTHTHTQQFVEEAA